MDFKADSGIPIPPPKAVGTTALLRLMHPGESRVFPNRQVAAIAHRIFGKGKYRVHKERDGIRVWRL